MSLVRLMASFFPFSPASPLRTSWFPWSRVKHVQHDWANVLHITFPTFFSSSKIPSQTAGTLPPASIPILQVEPAIYGLKLDRGILEWIEKYLLFIFQKNHWIPTSKKKPLDCQACPPSHLPKDWDHVGITTQPHNLIFPPIPLSHFQPAKSSQQRRAGRSGRKVPAKQCWNSPTNLFLLDQHVLPQIENIAILYVG